MRLANHLATAVLYVHSGHFVHKRIRPENIIIFGTSHDEDKKFPFAIGYPFLVGFDRSRFEHAPTLGKGDIVLEDCIYQHPDRWGVDTEHKFSMLHDVYSLGVVLLEIGIWKSFVRSRNGGERYVAWSLLQDLIDNGELKEGKTPKDIKDRFIEMAQKLLPPKMGRIYTNVVISCLSDDVHKGAGISDNELEEKVGMGYIRNVVSRLENLQIIYK